MIGDGWTVLGWLIVFALPLAVLVAVILRPERIPKGRTVEAIRDALRAGLTADECAGDPKGTRTSLHRRSRRGRTSPQGGVCTQVANNR